MQAAAKHQLRPNPLLKDIASFDRRFRAALGDWRRMDRVRGFGGPDNPYDDFAPKLERLFKRTRKAFEQRNMRLARDAYAALFATLALKDDYGFAITRPKSISIADEQSCYLRAVGETAPPGQRGGELTQGMHRLRRDLWEGRSLTVQALFECAPMPPDLRGAWLDEIIAVLRHDREREADRWLREAVRLRHGAVGLRELALRDRPWRPQAWLDWLEAFATQEASAGLLRAAKEALQNIPEGLESRALAADHLAGAAQVLADRESLLTARWEAFRAEPLPRRLLDLSDAARERGAQTHWMLQVVKRACDPNGGHIPGPFVDGGTGGDQVLFLRDGDHFTSGPTDGTTACALMLAGNWRQAMKMARDDGYPDWLGATTARAFILPVIMAWLVGWPERHMPAGVSTSLQEALARFDDPNETEERVSRRLRCALEEVVPTWKEPAQAVKTVVVNTCARLTRAGVQVMLDGSRHPGFEHAIVMVVAAAEVLQVQQSDAAALSFFDKIVARHRQHRDFASQLRIRSRQVLRRPSA
ncbi:MAG: hypothetical protein H7A46_17075 [Verrucomicrobiales bacterium]|nr:hypothetical protein [Verrucomicrobiales bacterium]